MAVIFPQKGDNFTVELPHPQPTSRTFCGFNKLTLFKTGDGCAMALPNDLK